MRTNFQKVVLSSTSSDSHTWNLVYLELLMRELGFDVVNLGACVASSKVIQACHRHHPFILVLSSVNGLGHIKGTELIQEIRKMTLLHKMKVVLGGKLTLNGTLTDQERKKLIQSGFDAIYSETEIIDFQNYLLYESQKIKAVA